MRKYLALRSNISVGERKHTSWTSCLWTWLPLGSTSQNKPWWQWPDIEKHDNVHQLVFTLCIKRALCPSSERTHSTIQRLIIIIFQLGLELATNYNVRIGLNAYWCCTIYPDYGCFLGVGHAFINIGTLLQVQQQGDAGHEGENGVQANSKYI